jgi:hypothetical protein
MVRIAWRRMSWARCAVEPRSCAGFSRRWSPPTPPYSLFAASGMQFARVARALGHSDTATTYKTYLHFFPDDFSADMDRLDAYLAPSAAPEVTPLRRAAER